MNGARRDVILCPPGVTREQNVGWLEASWESREAVCEAREAVWVCEARRGSRREEGRGIQYES